jgi:hypothetical protein
MIKAQRKRMRASRVGIPQSPIPTDHTTWRRSLYTLCFIDNETRWKSDLAIVAAGFLCAVVAGYVYQQDDSRVVITTVVSMLVLKLGYTIQYCYGHSVPKKTATTGPTRTTQLANLVWRYGLPLFVIALSSLFLPGSLKNHVAVAVLSKTNIGLLPGTVNAAGGPLALRFQSESNAIQNLIAQNQPANPVEVRDVRHRLETAVQTLNLPPDVRNGAIKEIVNLHGYETFSAVTREQGGSVAYKHATNWGQPYILQGSGQDRPGISVSGANAAVQFDGPAVIRDNYLSSTGPFHGTKAIALGFPGLPVVAFRVTIEGLTQEIGGITWIEVTFKHCVIIYDGGPVYMDKVKFIDCEFRISPQYRKLLDYFQTNGSTGVSFYQPSNDTGR